MIYVDTNIIVYAVGRSHPLREDARDFLLDAKSRGLRLVSSAETLQELLHIYLPVQRLETLASAFDLATKALDQLFPMTDSLATSAYALHASYPALTARDLIHLATCRQFGVASVKTYDKALAAAFAPAKRRRGR